MSLLDFSHINVQKLLHSISNAQKPDLTPRGIHAQELIPGRGDPLHDAALIWVGKLIKYVGPRSLVPETYADVDLSCRVPVLMPGLWDCHIHFLGARSEMTTDAMMATSLALAAARSVKDCSLTLWSSVTSRRELAGYGLDLVKAIQEGSIVGPNIYSCGAMLSQTGGHGDAHAAPLETVA